MSQKTILDRHLIVTMPCGERWAVPVRVIAENRAAFYADEFDGDAAKSLSREANRALDWPSPGLVMQTTGEA